MRRRVKNQGEKELYSLIPTSIEQAENLEQGERYVEQERDWVGAGGRCERCGLYFSTQIERMEAACVAHPGDFYSSGYGLTWKLSSGNWSCCGSKDPKSTGCLTLNTHKQCLKTREALRTLDTGNNSGSIDSVLSNSLATAMTITPPLVPERAQNNDPEEREGFIRHSFKAGETLPGVALMYNVSVQDIKRSNGIMSSMLDPGRKHLWIPIPGTAPTAPQRNSVAGPSALRALAAAEGLTINQTEAKYYLDEEGGDVGRAMAALKADMEWESRNSGRPAPW
jgi:hypothetical protein